ncbi:hypothetical protein FF1_038298 [Malus domestica]
MDNAENPPGCWLYKGQDHTGLKHQAIHKAKYEVRNLLLSDLPWPQCSATYLLMNCASKSGPKTLMVLSTKRVTMDTGIAAMAIVAAILINMANPIARLLSMAKPMHTIITKPCQNRRLSAIAKPRSHTTLRPIRPDLVSHMVKPTVRVLALRLCSKFLTFLSNFFAEVIITLVEKKQE